LASQLGALQDVVAYYRERGLLQTVDGSATPERVSETLLDAIHSSAGGRG
jgi:adenylate kinase family enzyme